MSQKPDKKMADKKAPKKRNVLVRWFRSTVLGKHDIDYASAETIETPLQLVVQNFFKKKTAIFGVVVFASILLFVTIGPSFFKLNLGEQDSTLTNIPPGSSMMKLPKELENNVRFISPGRTYGIGIDNDGRVHTWGHTRISDTIDIKDIPDEVQEAELEYIAAGDDHVVAIDRSGELYVWGSTRIGQARYTPEIITAQKTGKSWDIVQLEAGNQCSAALDKDGHLYLWGNKNNMDLKIRKDYQGNIAKIAFTANEYIALLKDGNAAYTGFKGKGSPFAEIPDPLLQEKTVDIAATAKTMAGLTEDGDVYVWGKVDKGEGNVPKFESKVVQLYGGRFHYSALLADGSVVSWGDDGFGQTTVPSAARSGNVDDLYVGYFQNYAVAEDGDVVTWGLKGFPLGTDNLGRDMLNRIINGGRVTMLVGAIAVIISTIIGIVLGGLAGYFGGAVDLLIMRVAEVVGGLPFIPFAMILSAVIGSRITPEQRMYLIMVVLGILSWVPTCRLVRAQFFAQREMEYVLAAKAMGFRESGIIFRHILPNIFSILLVTMTLSFATSMLTESTLSYLGFGIPLPTPTWGNLLNGANNSIVIQQYWWRWVFPSIVFGLCVICINLIGDALRDAMDPKSVER